MFDKTVQKRLDDYFGHMNRHCKELKWFNVKSDQ